MPALLTGAAAAGALLLTPSHLRGVTLIALGVAFGIFGNDLRRLSLGLRGYVMTDVVAAQRRRRGAEPPAARAPRPDRADDAVTATSVALVDPGSGNLASAARALALAAERAGIDARIDVTNDPDVVAAAERIVLPGQGAFADVAAGIAAVSELREVIDASTAAGTPFLGICVGMQIMAQRGLEHRVTRGFGWIAGEIAAMDKPDLRMPQMGWNTLDFFPGSHPLLEGLSRGDHAYFVHSYSLQGGDADDILATTDYGGPVAALVARGNRAGAQFHVEKSQDVGIRILSNFLRWMP